MNQWLAKPRLTATSARRTLEIGDAESAANRAYFAMFQAALALLSERCGRDVRRYKTHATVHSKLGDAAVKTGDMPIAVSKLIKGAENLRLRADYDVSSVTADEVVATVEYAGTFIAEVERLLSLPKPKP
jgi:uncharacterized protein (UPF0332 family)